jgi:hypothetical protein
VTIISGSQQHTALPTFNVKTASHYQDYFSGNTAPTVYVSNGGVLQ